MYAPIKMLYAESFLLSCRFYLIMLTTGYCIYLTANIILKRSSRYTYISPCLSFAIILSDLYKIFLDNACFLFFLLLLSRWLYECSFSVHQRLLKCVSNTARCNQASSFDINRAAVCHFHTSSRIQIRNDLSSICFTN
jgi:hypothetical protein